MLVETNWDALVGPTHHFGGLGVGNLASKSHRLQRSRPRAATLEGLRKARLVGELGVPQFVLPPPERPRLDLLSVYGFDGSPAQQLRDAAAAAPQLLSAIYSSAFMWAANAATVTPAADVLSTAQLAQMHLTPANLSSSLHRAPEAAERFSEFKSIFSSSSEGARFKAVVHTPLPSWVPLRDEGAANHMRLCDVSGAHGVNVFVHGVFDQELESTSESEFTRYLPRQTRAAFEMIARHHGLDPKATFYLRQHPDAISAGVFHNDVIATSHRHLLIHHEQAFAPESRSELSRIAAVFQQRTQECLHRIEISKSELTLEEAVESYLFNSQIVTPGEHGHNVKPDAQRMVMVAPEQCRDMPATRRLIDGWLADPDNPIEAIRYVRLNESMANGGGPACLRLRVMLPQDQLDALQRYRLSDRLYERLVDVVDREYPEQLHFSDLVDPEFANAAAQATRAVRACFVG